MWLSIISLPNRSKWISQAAVLAMDESVLDVDQVENLIKFCPTKEEMELLKVKLDKIVTASYILLEIKGSCFWLLLLPWIAAIYSHLFTF